MHEPIEDIVLRTTGAAAIRGADVVQQLWSGYGNIVRYHLKDANVPSVIVKHVVLDHSADHPRGWGSDIGHQRKLHSYQVETLWYQNWASRCKEACRVPHCLAVESAENEVCMVLEDLDASGWSGRRESLSPSELNACLHWLANFHATFLRQEPNGLWQTGTYWHLATRPDELQALDDLPLREAAASIDRLLSASPYQTFVHGDAKVANFCFPQNGDGPVAAVDFQYVGRGCGVKDLAYFVGSVLSEDECQQRESEILDTYFGFLRRAITERQLKIDSRAIEADWRRLYPVAWTDFHRFLKGWSPGHWKLNSYSERVAKDVVSRIQKGQLAPPSSPEKLI